MLKIIGSIIVIVAGSLAGTLMAYSYKRRPQELRELSSGLQLLETEIIYGATPLADAFERVSQSCDGTIGLLFSYASDVLRAGKGVTAAEAWGEALGRLLQVTSLKKDDLVILEKLGSSLGVSDQGDQEKHIRLVSEQMRRQIEQAENEASSNVKLWNYLGVSGAVVIVMILL